MFLLNLINEWVINNLFEYKNLLYLFISFNNKNK